MKAWSMMLGVGVVLVTSGCSHGVTGPLYQPDDPTRAEVIKAVNEGDTRRRIEGDLRQRGGDAAAQLPLYTRSWRDNLERAAPELYNPPLVIYVDPHPDSAGLGMVIAGYYMRIRLRDHAVVALPGDTAFTPGGTLWP